MGIFGLFSYILYKNHVIFKSPKIKMNTFFKNFSHLRKKYLVYYESGIIRNSFWRNSDKNDSVVIGLVR